MSKEKKFEENLADLEVIVQKLENGDVALGEAISEFQKGMQLSKELQKTLDQAEKTLVKVMQADGTETEMECNKTKN
ncbi:exodeoxyribonuclease VII small subunit [Streptococcus anginosus]|nr:exodeoxyribonuclease VII small subunit [Streptococcus anginosus]MED5797194.1 exodeoxyribonuclease VII small subunit [Streptococcus anginosus]MED5886870.1 exodeoxyribonuclease VII small subunit [Streptococcus anginosus]